MGEVGVFCEHRWSKHKVGMFFGLIGGGWHFIWLLLILLGLAQPLVDAVFWMHMLTVPYHVTGFQLSQAVILIIITFLIGYIGGWLVAWVWNKQCTSSTS